MGFWGPDADTIAGKLDGWVPAQAADEAGYEEQLSGYLHEQFPKEIFTRQYRQGNTVADLRVKFLEGAPVAIELKAALTSRNEYHRLVGQLWTYVSEWEHEVVVVLCGTCDVALSRHLGRLAEFLSAKKKVWVVSKRAELAPGLETT